MTPRSSSIEIHRPSRSDHITSVLNARSWPELFEAANFALGPGREEWGDELAQSWAALGVWQRCAFVVATAARIEMGKSGEHDGAPQASVLGGDVERDSFAAAKAIASALLCPLPSVERDKRGRASSSALSPLERALGQAKSCIQGILADLRAREMADPDHLSGALPTPKGTAINLLIGTSSWVALGDPGRLEAQALGLGWDDLAELSGERPEQAPHAHRIEAAQAQLAWSEAIEAGGFAYLACGPSGGTAQGAREARALTAACRSFGSRLRSMGIPEVGLGGLGVSVNASPVGDYGNAAFEAHRFDMVFKAPFTPTSLHHEWTHALDRMTRESLDPAAHRALDETESLITRLDPDAEAYERDIADASARLALVRRKLLRVEARFAKSACLPAGSEPWREKSATLECAKILWDGAVEDDFERACEKAVSGLAAHLLPGEPPINSGFVRERMREIGAARRELDSLLESRSKNQSAFISASTAAARKINARPEDYWISSGELLARAGQAHFADLLPPGQADTLGRLVLGGKAQNVHPIGAERLALAPALERWARACAPMASAAVKTRRAKNAWGSHAPAFVEFLNLGLSLAASEGADQDTVALSGRERDSLAIQQGCGEPSFQPCVFDQVPLLHTRHGR